MKDSELMRYISMRKYGTFTASYVSLYVYGICSTCARKQRRNKKTTQ